MMEQVTGRTDFLKKISSMTREEITEYMKSKIMRKKLIYPMIILFPKEEENNEKDNLKQVMILSDIPNE